MGGASRLRNKGPVGIGRRAFETLIVLTLLLVLSLPNGLFLAPASAQSGWGVALPIDNSDSGANPGATGEPQVAVDPFGNAIVVWTEQDAVDPPANWISRVWASRYQEGAWWSGTPISVASEYVSSPQVAVDERGNAISVWEQAGEIWASRYGAGLSWAAATLIGTGWSPSLAMDRQGNAVALWTAWNGTRSGVWGSRYVAETGWETAVPVDSQNTDDASGKPDVAMDSQGNAMAVWIGSSSGNLTVWASRYQHGVGWGIATPVGVADPYEGDAEVAMDPQGNAIAIWTSADRDTIQASRYEAGVAWGPAKSIGTDNGVGYAGGGPQIAMDAQGNALGVWEVSCGSSAGFGAARYTVGADWSAPLVVPAPCPHTPRVTMDSAGNATVVWSAYDGRRETVWATSYVAGFGWSPHATIGRGLEWAVSPVVATNSQGTGFAVWMQYYGTRLHVFANRYDGGTWGAAVPIERSRDSFTPRIAISPDGTAIAVWSQGGESQYSIWANVYRPYWGWGVATRIGPDSGDAFSAQIGVDDRGNAVVVWTHWDGFRWGLQSNAYVTGVGWGTAKPVEFGGGDAIAPHLAIDPEGNAVAVWEEWDVTSAIGPSQNTIRASRYVFGEGWSVPNAIEAFENRGVEPQVVVDGQGNAIAVWGQMNARNSNMDIMANSYSVGRGWGVPTLIENGADFAGSPRIAIDDLGNAVTVWQAGPALWANRFLPGVGWGTASQVVTNHTGFDHEAAMDDQGNAVVVWECYAGPVEGICSSWESGAGWSPPTQVAPLGVDPQIAVGPLGYAVAVWNCGLSTDLYGNPSCGDSLNLYQANRYVRGVGWGTPTLIGQGVPGPSPLFRPGPQVAIDSQGNAVVVWDQYDGNRRGIWANRYARENIPPELSIIAPSNGLTNNPTVTLAGQTEPGVIVTVNGTVVPVDPTGAFSESFALPDGTHRFVVAVSDLDGNFNSKTVLITVDTKPPLLSLGSPADGTTASTPTVAVSGNTEPGAQLVANGLSVAVEPDGSFSLRLALVEGENTIVVWATDAAGNVATASVTVTYVNPVVRDLALNRWVAIASSAGVLVLASLFLVLYRTRWRRGPRGPGESQNGLRLEDPNTASSQVSAVQRQMNGGVLVRGLAAEGRWPAKANSGPVRLTAKERILLHLLHFARYADASEVPRELTQERIVEAAGIDRRHFTQYVHPLVRDGVVQERTAHVRGAVQRRRVYVLTEEGRNRTLGVRDRIRSAMVRVRDTSGIREVTVAEALLEARGSMSVLDILRESIETGVVDLTR